MAGVNRSGNHEDVRLPGNDPQKVGQFTDWVRDRYPADLIEGALVQYPGQLSVGSIFGGQREYLVNCMKNKEEGSSLHIACNTNQTQVLEILLRQPHVKVNLPNSVGETPLHRAAHFDHVNCIKLLLRARGINTEAQNNVGRTALHDAVFDGKVEAIRALVGSTKDIACKKGEFALHTAAARGFPKVVGILHKAGFVTTKRNANGKTCLHVAVETKKLECVKMLTETLLMDPTVQATPYGKAPVSLQELARASGDAAVIALVNEYCKNWSTWTSQLDGVTESPSTCKVFFVGTEKVGKTVLLSSLKRSAIERLRARRHERDNDRDRTAGVNIVEWKQSFSCWDFAGQTDDYVTHDYFLALSNTIYLVLVKMTDSFSEQKQQLKHWLQMIKTCYRGAVDLDRKYRSSRDAATVALDEIVRAPVVVVFTHADKIADDQDRMEDSEKIVDEMRTLFEDFLCIRKEVVLLDALNASSPGMAVLKKTIESCRLQLWEDQPNVPTICAAIAAKLAEVKEEYSGFKSVLTFDKFVRFVHDRVNPLVDAKKLPEYAIILSATASLFYHKSGELSQYVILDPHWLCSDVLGIMLSPQRFEHTKIRSDANGVVAKDDLYTVLSGLSQDFLDRVMSSFELHTAVEGSTDCVRLPSLIVDKRLLDDRFPDDLWCAMDAADTVAIGRRFACPSETDNFSPGFFPRLQVRTWKMVQGNSVCRFWRGGLHVLSPLGQDGEMKQEMMLQICGRQIDIAFRGPRQHAVRLRAMLDVQLKGMLRAIDEFLPAIRLSFEALSSHDLLRKHAGTTQRHAYDIRAVCVAERERRPVVNPLGGEEWPLDILHAGVESHSFAQKLEAAHIMYLDDQCLAELCAELNRADGSCNWRQLAQYIAMGRSIEIFGVRPDEATQRIMERYMCSVEPNIKYFRSMLARKVKNMQAHRAVLACVERICPARPPIPESSAAAAAAAASP